jgi:hypothetical protein
MLNETHDPDNLRVICTYPTTPVSGGVVIYGDLCGVAQGNEDAEGYTVVKLGGWIGSQSVTDINTGGIAKGDPLFASKATPVVLSNLSTGVFFGWANATVGSGLTATIEVIKDAYAGGVVGAGSIGTTQLAAGAVVAAKLGALAASAASINYEVATLVFGATDASKTATVTAGNIIVGHYFSSVTGVPVGWPIKLEISSTTLTATPSAQPGSATGYTLKVVMLKAAGV